jgi:hypothetical protein
MLGPGRRGADFTVILGAYPGEPSPHGKPDRHSSDLE